MTFQRWVHIKLQYIFCYLEIYSKIKTVQRTMHWCMQMEWNEWTVMSHKGLRHNPIIEYSDRYALPYRGPMTAWSYQWNEFQRQAGKSNFHSWQYSFQGRVGPREITHKLGFPKLTIYKGAWKSFVASLSSSQDRAPYLAANEYQLL